MAVSPKTPTARKGPVTSPPGSKGSMKSQQHKRKASVSQAVPKTQQQRKNSNAQSSPKVIIHQRGGKSSAEVPVLVGNKRKMDAEDTLPIRTESQVKHAGAVKINAQPESKNEPEAKKQKAAEKKTETAQELAITSPAMSTPTTSNLQQSLVQSSDASQSSQSVKTLLSYVLDHEPALLPPLRSMPVTSSHIDAIAHSMWQAAFYHEALLDRACSYSALFSPLKLAALAKLNFLPSWWFFRDLAISALLGGVKIGDELVVPTIDDRVMQETWMESVKWCAGIIADRDEIVAPTVAEEENARMEAARAEELRLERQVAEDGSEESEEEDD